MYQFDVLVVYLLNVVSKNKVVFEQNTMEDVTRYDYFL